MSVDGLAGGLQERNGTYHMEVRDDVSPSVALAGAIQTVAEKEGTEFDGVLQEYIDVDSLDELYAHAADSPGTWKLTFDAMGFRVRIDSDGAITFL